MRQPPDQVRDSAARIDQALRAANDGLTMRELVTATGLHENALRRALSRLAASGSVFVESERRPARGRPRLRYRRAASAAEPFQRFLPLLVDLLDRSPAAADDAYAVGVAYGAVAGDTGQSTRGAILSSLLSLGFAPVAEQRTTTGADVFALSRCPFGGAVTSSAQGRQICSLHHGILAGIAEAHGGELCSFAINDPRVAPCRVSVVGASGRDADSSRAPRPGRR